MIIGCNKGTVVGRRLGRSIVHSLILLAAVNVGIILIRKNNPRVGGALGTVGVRDGFRSKLEIASGSAIGIIRVILTNGIGGSLIYRVKGLNNRTVNLSNVSSGVVGYQPLSRDRNFINSVVSVGARIVSRMLGGGFVPIVSAVNYSRGGGYCGVGTSAITTTITKGLGTRTLVSVASIINLLESGSSSDALVREICVSSIPHLVSRKVVANNVVPGVSSVARTVHRNIGGTFVVSKHIPRSVLVRVLASRNVNAVFEDE